VLLSLQDNTLTAAAADGFRLAVKKVELASPVEGRVDVIVPARTLQELARILDDDEGRVEVTVTPNKSQIMFHLQNVNLVSKLVEGAFPNYQQIIPQSHSTRVLVNANEFLRATKRASLFARESANAVKLGITPGDDLGPGRLTVTANASEVGDNHTELDAIVEGNAAQISFNAKYLGDVLGVLGSGQVGLEVKGPSSPGVIRPSGSDDYTHVIMPMHLAR
jgi:DNA polymerase-3 subunit beta